ncbi:MAG: response regulator [Acidobacteriota bacterium]
MRPTDPELEVLLERSPIGMYRATVDGRFLHVNPALARMLGYTADELLAKNLDRDIYADPTERPRIIARYRPLGVIDGVRVRWRHKDGRELIVQLHGHVVEREPDATFDTWAIDVTEVETRNAELRRTAAILDLCLRQMPAIWWMVDRDLRIVKAGGAIEPILGYPETTHVGRTLDWVHAFEGGTHSSVEPHRRALAGEIVTYETEYRGKLLANTIGPYRDADGQIVGVIGTCIDATAVRALETRMIDAQRAESLGVLAGGLAHDFNNLLVAVIGSAELALRELAPGAAGRGAIENIRDAGLRAAELTAQLLAYAGRGGAGTTRVYIAALVDELRRIVAPTIPEGVRVTIDIPGELAMRGDPAQVRQVAINLIANARDALAGRSGTIAVRGHELVHDGTNHEDDVLAAPAGTYVVLEVADDGPGFDSDTRRRVFEPFFTTKATGQGVGLAAVLGIVRAHGGGIRVASAPGRGARFSVLWPAAERARTASEPPHAAPTVLVVDDEDLVREVLARMIEDLGYTAVAVRDGAAALAAVDGQKIDAVLLDLTMPQMNGAEVMVELRARRPELPVVLCSGYDRGAAGPVQADAYLPKPFRIDALERTLAKLLALRSV